MGQKLFDRIKNRIHRVKDRRQPEQYRRPPVWPVSSYIKRDGLKAYL